MSTVQKKIKLDKKSNKYYFRIELSPKLDGSRNQKRVGGFITEKEAELEYYRMLLYPEGHTSQKDKTIIESSEQKPLIEVNEFKNKIKFKDFLNTYYLPHYKSQVKEQTYENRLNSMLVHFKFFYNYQMDEIKARDIQRWRNKIMEKCKASYVRSIQGQLNLLFDHAIILEYCTDNPSRAIGNVKKIKAKVEFWTKDEFEKAIKTFYKDDFYQHYCFMIIYLLFMTGMRIGEASAIQWKDIDFENCTLKIDKSLIYKNRNDFYFSDTKTKSSNRVIALDKTTTCFLKEWKERQEPLLKTGFVLSYNGLPTSKSSVSHILTRHSKLANIKRINTHALRHSHASFLIMLGENPLIIRDRLGHEDIETTLGTYGHLYPNTNVEVAQRLHEAVSVITSEEDITVGYAKNQFTVDTP